MTSEVIKSENMQMNVKKFLYKSSINFIVATFSVLFFLGIIELAVRFFSPQPRYYNPRYMLTVDADRGYKLTPGFQGKLRIPESEVPISINSRGLRDREHAEGYGGTTILGLGDSFAFGTGVEVEYIFLRKLEELLNKQQKQCRVINAGIPGYGTDQEYIFLKQEGLRYSPDLVIVNFYLNDVFDNVSPKFTVIEGYPVPSEKMKTMHHKFTMTSRLHIFLDEFHLYRLVLGRLSNVLRPLFLEAVIKAKGRKGNRLDLYSTEYTAETERAWSVTKGYLKGINDIVKKRNGKVLLVYIPERQQVYSDQWDKMKRQFDVSDKEIDILRPNEILKKFCQIEGIPFLDLTVGLQQAVKSGHNAYFTMDPHLSREGHNIAAEIIYRAITEKRLIPELQ